MANSDYTRLQPTADALNIILKNTHFKDGLLNPESEIAYLLNFDNEHPRIIFRFSETFYDFEEIFLRTDFPEERNAWLRKENIVIRLILADSVVTDALSVRSFRLDFERSRQLHEHLLIPQSF